VSALDDIRSANAAERLLEESWAARSRALPKREVASELAATLAFIVAAVAVALYPGALTGFDPAVAALLVAIYVVLARIEFPVGNGYVLPTHLALVPMLVLVPPGAVPGLVAAGLLLARVLDWARGSGSFSRTLFSIPDAWHAIGAALVLALAGETTVPLLIAALVAACAFDALAAVAREAGARGTAPSLQLKVLGQVWLTDACLAPIGLLAAEVARDAPAAVLGILPLAALLRVLERDRRRRIEQAQQRLELAERTARDLAHERLHDAVTGLANRTLLQDRAEHAVAAARRRGTGVAVLALDIDDFKLLNDSLGHGAGDDVLREVAARFASATRDGDTLSRFGAGEFVMLCSDVDPDDAPRLARRVQQQLAEPVLVGGRSVPLTCSVGIAVHAGAADPRDGAAIVRDAAAAVSSARERGRGGVELSERGLSARALARLDLELELRRAISNRELTVFYQPIVRLDTGAVCGVEALVRWRRPCGELVPPNEFIPLAEETGLICEIGEFVLHEAVAEVGAWAAAGLVGDDFRLSVNTSAHQLADPRLIPSVRKAIAAWGRPARGLCLEITETAVARDPRASQRTLDSLAALGVLLALDDFGVGHSSLSQLARSLPFTILKLDRSFVFGMDDPRERSIVAAVAAMARALDLKAVAEGVESAEQAEALAELGFPFAQGFHFGRPLPAVDLRARLSCAVAS
jgi:diguanylate cyclase (GGDEF)-like protein